MLRFIETGFECTYKNELTKCTSIIRLNEMKNNKGKFYTVNKQLIGENGFVIYNFEFNYIKRESAVVKFDKICNDLKENDFYLVEMKKRN